jgi:hypothetical protein
MSVQWIEYKGKRILYSCFKGMKDEAEIFTNLKLHLKMIANSKEPVLLLINVEDSPMTPANNQYTKEELPKLKAKVKKIAMVGITGLKGIIVDGIDRSVGTIPHNFCPTEDEAKEWLIQ